MKRRNLFKSLLGVAVAVSLDLGMVTPALPAVKKAVKVILNPAYANAPYEDLIWFAEGASKPSEIHRFHRSDSVKSPWFPNDLPPRYNYVDGQWVRVSPYLKVEV